MKNILLILPLCFSVFVSHAQDSILLYAKVPNAKVDGNTERFIFGTDGSPRVSKVSVPALTVFLPPREKANGSAVIICPGGGYARLSIKHEGYDVAKALNEWGVAAFVLKYRLPDDSLMSEKETAPLRDAQRAIQLVRESAAKWNINPKKVGMMGFSAGGHLAATAGTHFDQSFVSNEAGVNLRPDFLILLYPVISFSDSLAHKGSRTNLIGSDPSEELIRLYSNEVQVTGNTPPTFLVHARDDRTVKVENSEIFYKTLLKHKVPAEIHYYDRGGHGFGLFNRTSSDKWTDWLKVWMRPYL